ncbi:MAG: efflux transporter outer membrane subunit [Melioribacteraceae bacterium]|nr:efflux transporter outer membrane subunit [Melioribacteraceae bacterium]
MKKLLLLIPILLIISLSSCSVGPDFQKPQIDTLQTYRFDSLKVDSIANLEWWNLFDDSMIDTLVITALEENKDILIAVARIEEARAGLTFVGADRYPRLDIQAGAGRGNFAGGQKFISETNTFSVTPALSWEIDFWGKYSRATESARASLLASEYSLRTIQIALISEVIGTYFQLLDYKQRLDIANATVKSREKSLDIIQQRYDKGIIPEIDLNQAQIQREIAVALVPVFERFVSKTENTLSILLGKNPGAIENGKSLSEQQTPPEIPVGIPSILLQRRPDVLQAENLLHAQNARVGVAAAQQYPSFSLTALLGVASDDLSTLTSNGLAWSAGASLLGPLFNFNKNSARVEVEEAKTKQSLFNYERTVLNAFREVEDALVDIETYKREVEAKERQVVAAKNAEFLSRLRYNQGVASYLEVLDTERTSFSSALELSQTKQSYLTTYIKLYKALGGGWINKIEKENSLNNKENK